MSRDRWLLGAFLAAGLLLVAFGVSFVLGLRGVGSVQPPAVQPPARVLAADRPPAGDRVRVEVLNAGGRAGMARLATGTLRENGFDVVFYGNAVSAGRDSSAVLDRVGRPEDARAVAARLGIRQVRTEIDPERYVDVSVILGRDWSGGAARD
jgi:hypothetical protein